MLYTMVWAAIFLIPFMNAHLMSEAFVNFGKVIISWGKIAPYFIIFMVNTTLLAPRLLLRKRYILYTILLLLLIIAIFGTIEIGDFQYWQSDADLSDKASFTELEWYWNLIIGVLMAGANSMIKLYYRSLETEQRMAELEKQSIENEMQYLKYQINPHFLMNTLNNIHAMIDFDTKLVKLLEKTPVFESDEHRKAWLIRVTVNICRSRLRSPWRRHKELEETDAAAAEENWLEGNIVLDAVMALPDKYREVIHLFYYEDYSVGQIAALLCKKETTVRSLMFRARAIL